MFKIGLLVLTFLFITGTVNSGNVSFNDELFQNEIEQSLKTGIAGPILSSIVAEYGTLLKNISNAEDIPEERFSLLCTSCAAAVEEVLRLVDNGHSTDEIAESIKTLCVTLGISDHTLCDNFVDIAKPELVWILFNTEGLTGNDVCGTMAAGYGCHSKNPDRTWQVQLPSVPKPPPTDPIEPENRPVLKVLHLADTHYDPNYLPGSNANCEEKYFCCNEDSGEVVTPEDAAGYWGDYRHCDAPKWLLEAALDSIATNHIDIDFILWTGDLVPHAVWKTSRESNLNTIKESLQLVKDKFPGIPVYPALGNHESHPLNSYPQPYIDNEFDISWLYDEIKSLWMQWLPEEVAATVEFGGFYTTIIKPNLRLISLNSNNCYNLNWWLLHDSKDIASELDWLIQQLQMAEDKGEKVYIISHHPSGHRDCDKSWSHQYNKIIYRYEHVISGMFHGHTHNDHFNLFFDPENKTRAFHVGYIAQSITPYSFLNPGYKIYTIEGDFENSSYRVLDHENYAMDLDKANAGEDPLFYKLYSAKEDYQLDSLNPQNWYELVQKMAKAGSEEFKKFYTFYNKASKPKEEEGCNLECKKELICELLTTDTSDKSHCEGIDIQL